MELEFNSSISPEALEFNRTILPLFRKDAQVVTQFQKDGKKMLLAVAPVKVMLSLNRLYYRKLSLGIVLSEHTLSEKVEVLKRESSQIFLVEVLVFACLAVALLAGEWFLLRWLVSTAVRPLDELAETLDYMFKGDLELEIKAHTVCPADITALYHVFHKLKVAMRFGSLRYFTGNPATAEINLCQALELFQQFKNHSGAGQCWWHLGHLHVRCGRVPEAKAAFRSALEMAQLHQGPKRPLLLADRSYMLALYSEGREALHLLQTAVTLYETATLSDGKVALALFHLGKAQLAEGLLEEAEETHCRMEAKASGLGSETLMQKERFLAALVAEKAGRWQEAGVLYTETVTCSSVTDPAVHKEALERLQALFSRSGLSTGTVLQAMEYLKEVSVDAVFVIGAPTELPELVFDCILKEQDKVAVMRWEHGLKVAVPLCEKRQHTDWVRREITKPCEAAECVAEALPLACGILNTASQAWSLNREIALQRSKCIFLFSDCVVEGEVLQKLRRSEGVQVVQIGEQVLSDKETLLRRVRRELRS